MRLSGMVAVLAALAVVRWACPLRLAVVAGESMEPTLESGQLVLIDSTYYRSQPILRGDVIALRVNDEVMVKRVAAVAERRLPNSGGWQQESVFVRGDAAPISLDSRQFGAVPTQSVLGRVIALGIETPTVSRIARAKAGNE